jgi:hypothetical protein
LEIELKDGDRVVRHTATLSIQLDREPQPLSASEKRPPPKIDLEKEYTLLLYIEDRLIASSRKKAVGKIPFKIDIPVMPRNYDPFDPDAHRDPMTNAVSIFDALGLAVKTAYDFFKKDETRPVSTLRPLRRIQVDYFRKTPLGTEEPVSAIITLDLDRNDGDRAAPGDFSRLRQAF